MKYHWKHYCESCDLYFIGDSLEIECISCGSTDISSDYVEATEVDGLLQTEDFQEFCEKLQQLMKGAQND